MPENTWGVVDHTKVLLVGFYRLVFAQSSKISSFGPHNVGSHNFRDFAVQKVAIFFSCRSNLVNIFQMSFYGGKDDC